MARGGRTGVRRHLTNPNVLSAVLAAAVGGALAILGGLVGSYVTLSGERGLRQEQRRDEIRGAAQTLDHELYARTAVALQIYTLKHPPGDIRDAPDTPQWRCIFAALDSFEPPSDKCERLLIGSQAPEERDQQLSRKDFEIRRLDWSATDRRLLAVELSGPEWFAIRTAVDDWNTFANDFPRDSAYLRATHFLRRLGSNTAVLTLLRELIPARKALADHLT